MAFLNEQGLERLWTHITAKLGNKVDKESGKGLSTNDYTDEEKNKLASVSGSIESLNTLVGDTNVSTQIGNAINAIDYPVDSVNGKTGAVTLSASDVGALPNTYTIPTASSSTIGGVKVGNGLLINNGSLSVDVVDNLTSASTTKPLSAAQGKALNDAIKSITTDLGDLGAGDMLTATYDKDKDGIVDNAAKLEGHSASYFATASALDELDNLVGDTAVSTQINDAITELDLENTYAPIHTHPYIESNEKGSANGVAELDANGKVPSAQLPSYVDDVLEYSTKSNFPSTGESGKIYVDTSVNKTYRWGGSSYVEISASLALGETSSTAYRGDYGKIAYTHSQITDGNPHGITCAKINAVPTSRTVNGKALSANITLSAGDVGADASGAADTALTNAKAYTDAEITEWVGDNTVSAQISAAIANKSDTDHTHIWNEINNKPFISDASDTLTWDGNTEGLVVSSTGITYKVSDTVITIDDLSNGCIIHQEYVDEELYNEYGPIEPIVLTFEDCQNCYSEDNGTIMLDGIYIIPEDDFYFYPNNDPYYPEAGIYFISDDTARATSITIPGYHGFIRDILKYDALPEHTHDDLYYTESEIDTKLSGKANSSHGNHVPATETANNAKFLRNDNTWQTVTPANIGAAASSHGTHVSYSTTAPVMDGTASAGSASTVARSDHKHPTDTSRAAASDLTALQTLVGDTKVSTQISTAISNHTSSHAPSNAEANVQSNWTETSSTSDAYILNKPSIKAGGGTSSIIEGYANNTSSGNYSHAEGYGTSTDGNYAHAEGSNTAAKKESAHAEGKDTVANGVSSHTEGYKTTTVGESAHAEGYSNATCPTTITYGTDNDTVIEAYNTSKFSLAKGRGSHTEGYSTLALGDYSHSEGSETIASGENSHSEGYTTTASGIRSHAEGYTTTASGTNSHAEGYQVTASGSSSHAEGQSSVASGSCAHAEGISTRSKGQGSHAEGYSTTSIGYVSHAEGYSTNKTPDTITSSTSNTTIIETYNTTPFTLSKGQGSHAEGYDTLAIGSYASHAEGRQTKATGDYSHAEGQDTLASGIRSHAEGYGTIAKSSNQHVQGKYNIEDTSSLYAHIVGNGSASDRSNAYTLDWDGNAWFAGNIYLGGTSQDDATIKGFIVHNSTTSLPAVTNGAILIAYDA